MRSKNVLILLFFFVSVVSAQALMVGDKAPDFTLSNANDESINLKELMKDHYVLIHFWSPSTIKSRNSHKFYNKIAIDYKETRLGKSNGLVVLSVCLEQLRESWEMAVVKDGMNNVQNVWDKNGFYSVIAKSYQLMKVPADFFVSPSGVIVMIDPTEQKLQMKINELKKEAPKSVNMLAKLLYGNPKDLKPLVHQKVFLISGTDTIKVAETDDYGDFEFKQVFAQGTEVAVGKTDQVKDAESLYLAQQNGLIISKFNRSASGFNYKLLDKDVARVSEVVETDPGIKLDMFSKSKDKELLIVENIYYASGDFKVSEKTLKLLDKIVTTMKATPTLKLEVFSHTDASGDDASNKTLSDKRAKAVVEYLTGKGIEKARLKSTGMGETKILNRCSNGIKCSEKENELNRRTEFKFIK
ncbi:MAG: OmpA family protein [Bacteroidota bacterium]|nr:OmpA family protein [Bacteroidota bacterium]